MSLVDADDALLLPPTRTKKPKRPSSHKAPSAVVFGSTPITDGVGGAAAHLPALFPGGGSRARVLSAPCVTGPMCFRTWGSVWL